MRKPMLFGLGLLLAAVVVGCGSSPDDAVMKEQLSLMNEMAAIFENAKDPASLKIAQEKLVTFSKKANDLKEKVKDWSEDKKKAMEAKYKTEFDAAKARVEKAMLQQAPKLQ
jgi:hypothetical protein